MRNMVIHSFTFFQMRFHKKPNLIKTRSPDELKETKQRQNSRTKNVKNNSGNHVENQNQNFDPNDNPIGMKIYSSSSNSRSILEKHYWILGLIIADFKPDLCIALYKFYLMNVQFVVLKYN